MTVRELMAKADKHTEIVTIVAYGSSRTYRVDEVIPAYFLEMGVVDYSYFIYTCEPLKYILWIRANIIF